MYPIAVTAKNSKQNISCSSQFSFWTNQNRTFCFIPSCRELKILHFFMDFDWFLSLVHSKDQFHKKNTDFEQFLPPILINRERSSQLQTHMICKRTKPQTSAWSRFAEFLKLFKVLMNSCWKFRTVFKQTKKNKIFWRLKHFHTYLNMITKIARFAKVEFEAEIFTGSSCLCAYLQKKSCQNWDIFPTLISQVKISFGIFCSYC